jgi:hypothetical protein
MSATPGKVQVCGVAEVKGEKVFVLNFIQARNADWVQVPFFARYNENAIWLDELKPAFNEKHFFFEQKPQSLHLQHMLPEEDYVLLS